MSSLLNTNVYDYMNVLNKAADAAWLRNDCISNNLANVDTPGYKREDVDFEATLKRALGRSRYTTLDAKVAKLNNSDLRPKSYIDYGGFSYRMDGNNVDVDVENVYLAENQLRYQGITNSITAEFNNLKTVLK